MDEKELFRLSILIEIYDRELNSQSWFHKNFHNCNKCRSLRKQRREMICKLKGEEK